jgi:hypothetical protein
MMAQTGEALRVAQEAATPAVHDDPAIQGFAVGEPVPGRSLGQDADDGFDDDIMAGHQQAGEAQRSEVMSRLDPDGDGQINTGIIGPRAAPADPDDPFAGADWQQSRGDALLGDHVAAPGDPVVPGPAADDAAPPWPDAPPEDVAVPDAPPEPVAPPEPEPVDEAPDPVAPVDLPDDTPDPAPVDDTPDLPDEPPPPPEPVTHDDADWLN